jgi:signal transduction histidine kinase
MSGRLSGAPIIRRYSQGFGKKYRHIAIRPGCMGMESVENGPLALAELSADPLAGILKKLGIRACAWQPLLAEGRLLGVLSFCSLTKDSFETQELEFFRTLCHYIAIASDRWRLLREVTQRAQELENRVTERTRQLHSMVEDLEAFSYSVSHDLRSPLRAMVGFASLALERGGEGLESGVRDYLQKIINSAARADQLVRDVLTYSRVSRREVELVPIDLERLLREQVIPQSPAFQPPRAEIELRSPLLPVMGNEACLGQCLTNLLSNATKFVLPGTIPRLQIWAEPRDGQVRIWVTDNGIGIESTNLTRIFRIFERVHSTQEYEGTGIGLAIVRKAAERMGGSVGVESEPGTGSKFWIQLKSVQTDEQSETNTPR